MSRRGQRVLRVVVGAAGIVVLAACGSSETPGSVSKPTPSVSQTPSVAPSPLPSSTAIAGVQPPPMTAMTQAGAEEFLRAYVVAVNVAVVSGDPTALEAYSTPTCQNCAGTVRRVKERKAAGQSIRDESLPNPRFEVETVVGDVVAASVYVDVPEQQVYDGSGAVVDTSAAKAGLRADYTLAYAKGRWFVTGEQYR